MDQDRTVSYQGAPLTYRLERKRVKNLNLRIREDGSVRVSVSPRVPAERVDEFVRSKGAYILDARLRFAERAERAPPRRFISGELFYILGRPLRLAVETAEKNEVFDRDDILVLRLRADAGPWVPQRLVTGYLDGRCRAAFAAVLAELVPAFASDGVAPPALRLRDMKTRWGTCLVQKGIVTLNKRLLPAPRVCVEYVVMHELCHFLCPDHSPRFYAQLTRRMPDWRERRALLSQTREQGALRWP